MSRKPRQSPAGKKPVGDRSSRHAEPREAFHLPAEMQAALEFFAATSEPAVNKSAVVRLALQKLLTSKGCYPPSKEQLRELLAKKGHEGLSKQVKAYLKEQGLG